MLQKIKGLFIEEEGQALTEYGLLLGLIAVGCIVAITTIGDEIAKFFVSIADSLTGTTTP
ncbi:Flp family type IVb pilin [Rhodococcus qingshengii]|nr:Flp family type IVb pilin [Rhodococcus qingshengii]